MLIPVLIEVNTTRPVLRRVDWLREPDGARETGR